MCGIFGTFNHPEAATMTYLGLYALNHRGQESAGICASDGENLTKHKAMGLVRDVFNESILRNKLKGRFTIGHTRYSTTGSSVVGNAQPIIAEYQKLSVALAHNGNLVNNDELRQKLDKKGAIFYTTSDTETIHHLMAHSREQRLEQKIIQALRQVKGAYSLLLLTGKKLIAIRDPFGIRPLSLGQKGKAFFFSSETCAFDLVGAKFIRDLLPGEILVLEYGKSPKSIFLPAKPEQKCPFEFIYITRPDSKLWGRSAYEVKKELGRQNARENPVDADFVIPVPDSGVPAAFGYSEESGIPLEPGMVRNHYVGRTFIEPLEGIRHFGVKIKLNMLKEFVRGKRVIIVDDSIVRGTTSMKIVKMVRAAGAKEVHMRISSAPIISSCYYGVDTPTRNELIARQLSIKKICSFITADSLGYLSLEGQRKALQAKGDFCEACFTGKYPIH